MQERILFFQLNWMAAHNSSIQFGWKNIQTETRQNIKKNICFAR